jgi:hypothetical protein
MNTYQANQDKRLMWHKKELYASLTKNQAKKTNQDATIDKVVKGPKGCYLDSTFVSVPKSTYWTITRVIEDLEKKTLLPFSKKTDKPATERDLDDLLNYLSY